MKSTVAACAPSRGRADTAACDEDQGHQAERERARSEREREQDRKEADVAAGGPQCEQPDRKPERIRKRAGENGRCSDERECARGPWARCRPLRLNEPRECPRGEGGRGDREQLDPDDGGHRVVEEAVGDVAVVARVPVVAPECEAVLDEHRALVDVGREVGTRWTEPRERRGAGGGGERAPQRLAAQGALHRPPRRRVDRTPPP